MIFQIPSKQITSPDEILNLCNMVSDYLRKPYKTDKGNEVEERAVKITEYMTMTGRLFADAKYHVENILNSEFMAIVKESMGANLQTSTINKRLEVITKDYNYLVIYSDRMNKACTHELKLLEGLLFKLGQEVRAGLFR